MPLLPLQWLVVAQPLWHLSKTPQLVVLVVLLALPGRPMVQLGLVEQQRHLLELHSLSLLLLVVLLHHLPHLFLQQHQHLLWFLALLWATPWLWRLWQRPW